MKAQILIAPAGFLLAFAALIALMLSGRVTSEAVQNPTMAIDMVTTGNSYDDTTNTMSVGTTENCLTTGTGDNLSHFHSAHVVIKNVEDFIGWQVRLNYLGERMRPSTVGFAPFTDNTTGGQTLSFNNLPIEAGVHRDLVPASSIPPQATGPQTASFGAAYNGAPTFAVSPDTPAKPVPDDSSYSAPTGGVLASLSVQVPAGNAGQQLFMNLDDGTPNGPGSGIAFFNGSGSQDVLLPSSALGDGFHGEGVPCVPQDCTTVECPPVATATPTVTPTPGTPTPTTPATPTPTPTASGNCPSTPTPTPTGPQSVTTTFTNGAGQTASDMHARYDSAVYPDCIVSNAPGCPIPSATMHNGTPPARPGFDLDWGTACVDPGESVTVRIFSGLAPLRCLNWTINGSPIGSDCDATPTRMPTPTPTCTSVGTGQCPTTPTPTSTPTSTASGACPTPTPTVTPTFTPVSGTPTPTPTGTGTPPTFTTTVVICNDTGEPVTDLHVLLNCCSLYQNPNVLQANAPGCPQPAKYAGNGFMGANGEIDLVWPSACVDPFETVTLFFGCSGSACDSPPHPPQVSCFNWTRAGTLLASARPCTFFPFPTPFATFTNNTLQPLNDLHFRVLNSGLPVQVLLDNAPGCSDPTVTPSGSDPVLVDVVWPSTCVDPNESVSVAFFSSSCTGSATPCRAPQVGCFYWTISGSIIGTPPPCPQPNTPTPTATATPAGHDSRLARISGVARNVRLSAGTVVNDTANIVVSNQSAHTDTIGVYVDVLAPAAGGCTPNGRVLQTTVTLGAGAKTTIPVPVSYSCADPAAANGLSFTWMAVADHGADDLASCGPGTLQGVACFDALADDDQDPADNRATRNGPRVIAQ